MRKLVSIQYTRKDVDFSRSSFRVRGDVVDMRLDFFVPQPDGRYERYCDAVRERAYSDKTMRKLLRDSGWQVLAVYNDMTFDAPAADSERVVYVVRNTRTREEATGNG